MSFKFCLSGKSAKSGHTSGCQTLSSGLILVIANFFDAIKRGNEQGSISLLGAINEV